MSGWFLLASGTVLYQCKKKLFNSKFTYRSPTAANRPSMHRRVLYRPPTTDAPTSALPTHQPPTTDYRSTDKCSTDQPTTNHRLTDRSTNLPVTDSPTHELIDPITIDQQLFDSTILFWQSHHWTNSFNN